MAVVAGIAMILLGSDSDTDILGIEMVAGRRVDVLACWKDSTGFLDAIDCTAISGMGEDGSGC